MTSFNDLGLSAPILAALEAEGYTQPTPIQAQAIPGVLAGRDLLGIAQTGTGKTAAFALPILERLAADRKPAPRKGCRVLVLSPTRELATQIADSFRTYGKNLGMKVAVVFGGVAHRPQIQTLSHGVDVLVATPGRLIDHMDERNIDIAGTEILVLDEADQMLDLGFVKPIRRIVSRLSQKRQSLFFSATMPHEIGALAAELLRDPLKVSVAPAATTVDRVDQKVIHIEAGKKRTLLVELFGDESLSRTLVFTRTKRGADKVAKHLETAGIKSAAIHGNKSQAQRERALDAFREAEIRVLVATDIAARGIDIDGVSHVINYELPEVPEAYVHRIGRTARAGAAGIAISLCDAEERSQLREIERTTRRTIPAEDRRNDTTLAVDKPMPRQAEHVDERARGPRRNDGRRDGPRHRGNGGDRGDRFHGGGHRADRPDRSDRPARAERPHHSDRVRPDHAAAPRREEHAERPVRAERPERDHREAPGSARGFDKRPAFLERPARADGAPRRDGEHRGPHRGRPHDGPRRDNEHKRPEHAARPHRNDDRPARDDRGADRRPHEAKHGDRRPEHRSADGAPRSNGHRAQEHRGNGGPHRDRRDGESRNSDTRGREHQAREHRGSGGNAGRDSRGPEHRSGGPGGRPHSARPHSGNGNGPRRFSGNRGPGGSRPARTEA